MSKLEQFPFREAYANLFAVVPAQAKQFGEFVPILSELGKNDQAVVHVFNGRILMVTAYVEIASGVAEVFLFPTVYALQHKKVFFREAKWCVQHMLAQFRRVQTYGEDTDLSRRWLKKLGFEFEGCLKKYTIDGSSMLLWGVTK